MVLSAFFVAHSVYSSLGRWNIVQKDCSLTRSYAEFMTSYMQLVILTMIELFRSGIRISLVKDDAVHHCMPRV